MVNSPLSWFGISSIAVALAAFFVWAVVKATPTPATPAERRVRARRAIVGTSAWLVAVGAIAQSGVLTHFDSRPPPLMLVVVGSFLLALWLGLSRIGGQLATLPLPLLVGWQAFRFPLELTMHHAQSVGLMPRVMSYSGRNYDIVTGVTALVLAAALMRFRVPRSVVVAWQLMGSALLVNVVSVAIAATPLFRAFGDQQLNTWIAYFPYVWLPAVMVVSAIVGHIVIFRHLLTASRGANSPSH